MVRIGYVGLRAGPLIFIPTWKEATQNGPLNHPNKDTQNLKYTNKRYEIGPLNHPSKDIQKWSP